MKVFKFGGASVQDAKGIVNVTSIIKLYSETDIVIVVSALGKTTNNLEKVVEEWYQGNVPEAIEHIFEVRKKHIDIVNDFEIDNSDKSRIISEIDVLIHQLKEMVQERAAKNFNMVYDQIVSFGELLSTRIIASYLNLASVDCNFLDARDFVVTNDCFRDARINWSRTAGRINALKKSFFDGTGKKSIVQGFIGRTEDNLYTTTLGREGSDFTASIFAFCLDAKEVIIWKDVPGVLNADPRLFPHAILIPNLSYLEAVEMTYYGASVIHPKTIKPLQNKLIPLRVKSFLNPTAPGTLISNQQSSDFVPPSIIVKKNQVLISFSSRDFSFIAEESLSIIFGALYKLGIKAHLTQNAAISFSLCVDFDYFKVTPFVDQMKLLFDVELQKDLELITLRNYSDKLIGGFTQGRTVYLDQRTPSTAQLVIG